MKTTQNKIDYFKGVKAQHEAMVHASMSNSNSEVMDCSTCKFHYVSGTYNSPKCFPFKNKSCAHKENTEFNIYRDNKMTSKS